MKRFKQIMFFALLIVAFAVFTNFISRIGLKNTYKTISGQIKSASPEIVVSEAKASDVNGYVKGTIKNNTETDIEKTFIKVDIYSKRNNILGDKYLEVIELKAGESKEFEIKFSHNNVDHYEIICLSEVEQ